MQTDRNETVARATTLRKQGKTWTEITKIMAAEGYVSRNGRPYTHGGLHTMVAFTSPDLAPRYRDTQKPNTKNSESQNLTPKNSLANRPEVVIELSKSIINLGGVDNETKLELLSRIVAL